MLELWTVLLWEHNWKPVGFLLALCGLGPWNRMMFFWQLCSTTACANSNEHKLPHLDILWKACLTVCVPNNWRWSICSKALLAENLTALPINFLLSTQCFLSCSNQCSILRHHAAAKFKPLLSCSSWMSTRFLTNNVRMAWSCACKMWLTNVTTLQLGLRRHKALILFGAKFISLCQDFQIFACLNWKHFDSLLPWKWFDKRQTWGKRNCGHKKGTFKLWHFCCELNQNTIICQSLQWPSQTQQQHF